ncbi:armadillo-type protein [Phycomyces nitens]|nr:armadillo-type protein [Phycomyces nitens]
MSDWKPQQQGLRELIVVLRNGISPDGHDQAIVQQRLESFNEIEDYNSYLVYILTVMRNEDAYTRAIAGLTLKNNIRSHFNNIPLYVLEYVKSCCTASLQFPESDEGVRRAVGSVITALVTQGEVHNWPEILEILVNQLDSPNIISVQMAWNCLSKICEDAARDLDQEINGIRPLSYMIPKFIQFFYHHDTRLRVQAIGSTGQFVLLGSQSLMCHMEAYLAGLSENTNHPSSEVQVEVCRSLVMVLEARPDKLKPLLPQIIEYMIYSTNNPNEQVALEACDFWLQFANVDSFGESLLPYLQYVVPALLSKMVYSETDLMMFDGDEEDYNVADNECDIAPRSYRHKTIVQSKKKDNQDDEDEDEDDNGDDDGDGDHDPEDDIEEDEEDEGDFDDDDFYSEWTLRKCSAGTLDRLSNVYTDNLVSALLKVVNHNLMSNDWKQKECGILALGAVAEGGIKAIEPHLPSLIPFLIKCLDDPKPLVRSISCWAISRYSKWCVDQCFTPTGREDFFEPVLLKLLDVLLDRNKRVQEAACSAFATLEERAMEQLEPYLQVILSKINAAFRLYQHKNLLVLYDALGTLAESVGEALNQPMCVSVMMPPLIEKWNGLTDQSTDLFPLLECLSSITTALRDGFAPYAEPVFSRCVKLIASHFNSQYIFSMHPDQFDPPDVEFLIVALDLLSGMVQGFGSLINPFVASSDPPLVGLLVVCIHDPVIEVLQSTYALIGDLAIACFDQIENNLPDFMPELIKQLSPDINSVSVYNNATWAAGEIAMRWNGIDAYAEALLECLIPILTDPEAPESLQENVIITIGRLGLSCSHILSQQPTHFVRPWLRKSRDISENSEKDTAFQGMCRLINVSPNHFIDELPTLLVIISQWEDPSPELFRSFGETILGYNNMLTPEKWKENWECVGKSYRNKLTERYGITG